MNRFRTTFILLDNPHCQRCHTVHAKDAILAMGHSIKEVPNESLYQRSWFAGLQNPNAAILEAEGVWQSQTVQMSQVWKLLLLLAVLIKLQRATSEFAIDYNALDMMPVRETEEKSVNEVYRASDNDSQNSTAWDQTKLWVVVVSSISLCFLILPLVIYLLCPSACICGCKPVTVQRTRNNL